MTDAQSSPEKETLLPCPLCGSKAAICVLEDEPGETLSAWVACDCGLEIRERLTEAEAIKRWNTRAPAQRAPGWIDQNHQIDRYGVALMMIGLGCADPAELATRVLSEFGVSLPSTMRATIEDPHEHSPPCGSSDDCPYPECLVDGKCASVEANGPTTSCAHVWQSMSIGSVFSKCALCGVAVSSPNRGASDV